MKEQINQWIASFVRSFFQGAVLLAPIVLTLWIVWKVVFGIDSLIPSISQKAPGVIFVFVILGTAFIGRLGHRFFLGKIVMQSIDYLFRNTPGVKFIYTSLRDVVESFVGDKNKFNHPVLVKTQTQPELWRVGFLTQQSLGTLGLEDMVAVYLPHSYAVSGWVIFTKRENIKEVPHLSAADAMKFAVSGGVSGLQKTAKNSLDITQSPNQEPVHKPM